MLLNVQNKRKMLKATTVLRPLKGLPWMAHTMARKVSPSLPTTVLPSRSFLILVTNENNHVVITAIIPVNKVAGVEESMLDGEVKKSSRVMQRESTISRLFVASEKNCAITQHRANILHYDSLKCNL